MYKIYFGERVLWIVTDEEQALRQSHRALLVRYSADQYHLLNNYIALLMQPQTDGVETVILQTTQTESLYRTITKLFYVQEAAGGLVYTPQKDLLAIYRRGCWDLPKGKIDAGETPEQAALREVKEETGVQKLTPGTFIGCTYHVFHDRGGKRVLKKTYWWEMQAPEQPLVPQKEEDIERALWIRPDHLLAKRPIYRNIVDILHQKHPEL